MPILINETITKDKAQAEAIVLRLKRDVVEVDAEMVMLDPAGAVLERRTRHVGEFTYAQAVQFLPDPRAIFDAVETLVRAAWGLTGKEFVSNIDVPGA